MNQRWLGSVEQPSRTHDPIFKYLGTGSIRGACAAIFCASLLTIGGCGEDGENGSGAAAASSVTLDSARVALESGDAAPTYAWCFDQISPDLIEAARPVSRSGSIDDATAARLEQSSTMIEWLIAASAAPRCEFNVDLSQGVAAKVLHLPEMRALTYVLSADAIRLMRAGEYDASAKRLTALVGMSRHLGAEPPLTLQWMVAAAVLGVAIKRTEQFIDTDAPTGPRATVFGALSQINRREPFGASRAIRAEGHLLAYSIREDLLIPEITIPAGADREVLADDVEQASQELARIWRSSKARLLSYLVSQDPAVVRLMPDIVLLKDVEAHLVEDLSRVIARLQQ